MTRTVSLLAAVLSLTAGVARAQLVQGVVLEDGTDTPVAGALVELFARNGRLMMGVRSDADGGFLLRPSPGRYYLKSSHPFYIGLDSLALTVPRGDVLGVELRMGRAAIPLRPLLVRARGRASALSGFEERRRQPPAHAYFITRQDIEEHSAAARTTDLLRSVPGVEILPVKRGGNDLVPANPYSPIQQTIQRVYVINLRGQVGNCQPALFLDGMRVSQFMEAGIDEMLQPAMIEGVEIYPGSASLPSGFDAPNACGAVLFWCRRDAEGAVAGWRTRLIAAGAALLLVLGGAAIW
jgi:hypothetical protein